MNVFEKIRSEKEVYACEWLGWAREKSVAYNGEQAEKLSLSCSSPEMIYKSPVLFTTVEVCRVCDKWCSKEKSKDEKL